MGKGYDYVREVAIAAAQAQLAKLFKNNTLTPGDCQVGRLNQTRTLATLPDGTQITVNPQGLVGDFAVICNGMAVVPEPTQVSTDDNRGAGLIIGFDQTAGQYYLRHIGSANKAVIPMSTPTNFSLDERIVFADRSASLSADGKALMIGGVFQDIPKGWNPQENSATFNNAIYRTPQPGYSYHTIAQWIIYLNPTVVVDAQGVVTFNYSDGFEGQLDLTDEAQDKIPAPIQQGLGSNAVYRLFPSHADLYLPTLNTVDGSAGYASARFFPASHMAMTSSTPDYELPKTPFPNAKFSNWTTSGDDQIQWSGDGHAYPLFRGKNQPWGCTPSNIQFVFNCGADGSYTLDIVSDISYATLYKIDFERIQAYNTFNYLYPASLSTSNNSGQCYTGHTLSQSFTYTIEEQYPFLLPFHNLGGDRYLVSGLGGPFLTTPIPQIVYFQGGQGTFLGNDNHGHLLPPVAGSQTAVYTDFGPLCPGFDCIYFSITAQGPDGSGGCRGPGLTESCDECGSPSTGNFQITDWDGTFFSINDYGPLFSGGLSGLRPAGAGFDVFFLFLREGGCNPPSCPGNQTTMSIIDNFFFDFTGGGGDAYRFGRGICAFNKVAHIEKIPGTSPAQFAFQDQYQGPSITLSRLMSPLAQDHLYQSFRSPSTGATACTYQVADPYIPPTSGQNTVTWQQFLGELFNFDSIAYNGGNPFAEDPGALQNPASTREGFSAFFFAGNYTNDAQIVSATNFSQTPDVMTDKVLAPHGTWPFADQLLKGADSFIIQGMSGFVDGEEFIINYKIAADGQISIGKTISGPTPFAEETIMDFIAPLQVGNNA